MSEARVAYLEESMSCQDAEPGVACRGLAAARDQGIQCSEGPEVARSAGSAERMESILKRQTRRCSALAQDADASEEERLGTE